MTKWIKATEQLPEQRSKYPDYRSDPCIVAIRLRSGLEFIETGFYSWEKEAWVICIYTTNDVIAWMPLPDFPKEM